MPVFKVAGNSTCELCGEELQIRCSFGVREGWGICDECGVEYTFSPSRPDMLGGLIDSVECQSEKDSFGWTITEEYYNSTGRPAVLMPYIEFTNSEIKSFHQWRETGDCEVLQKRNQK